MDGESSHYHFILRAILAQQAANTTTMSLRKLVGIYRKAERKLNNPLVIKSSIIVEMVACGVITILSGMGSTPLSYTDSVPFYVMNLALCAFGLVSVFLLSSKKISQARSFKLLVAYLLLHMAFVVALSFGIGRFFSSRTIHLRLCEVHNLDCTNTISAINNSVIRNAVLIVIQIIFLHPITTFVLFTLQRGDTRVKSTL